MRKSNWSLSAAVAVFLALGQVGCDAVVDPGDHPAGVVFLSANGSEAARFVYQQSISGTLVVPVGGSVTYRVRVLTESGDIVDLDGDEYSLGPPTVGIGLMAGAIVQGDDQIVLTGATAGGTTLRFNLNHGEHAEFEVRDVPLSVQN